MTGLPGPPPPGESRFVTVIQELCGRWLGSGKLGIEPLAAGFSGAAVYRIRPILPAGEAAPEWVLKSLARETSAERIAWVHGLMRHLRRAGVVEVPAVAVTPSGETTVVDAEGDRWELVAWVRGVAINCPTVPQAAAAGRVLARLHLAAATLPGAEPRRAAAPAISRRIEHARRLLASPWTDGCFAAGQAATPLQRRLATRLSIASEAFREADGRRAVARLAGLVPPELPLQAVIRDVSRDHVLYADRTVDEVAGIIDHHAAAIDTPATDLARLVGSWCAAERPAAAAARTAAVDAYEGIRPLEHGERAMLPLLAASGVVFGLDNWFRWVLAESRDFAQPAQVVARVDELLASLTPAIRELASGAKSAV